MMGEAALLAMSQDWHRQAGESDEQWQQLRQARRLHSGCPAMKGAAVEGHGIRLRNSIVMNSA